LRALRVAVDPIQLALPDLAPALAAERWWLLPEATRGEVLTLLARLIARGVLIDATAVNADATAVGGSGGGDE
jgi:hypothetical protein